MALMTTRELIERYGNVAQRNATVEAAAEAGMPYSAYLDSQYDPDKDGELGPDDERLSAMEVILDTLDMTTTCNPAAGIWPTRCEAVIGDPAKELALKEMCLNAYRSVAYAPQIAAAARRQERRERWERAGTFQTVHDTAPGSSLTPYYDAMAHWDQDVEVDIRLEELTSRFTETSKSDYRATILKYDKNAFTEERRTAAADPPMATFDTSERPIQLKKRMLAIPFTYEHLREVEFVDKAMEHVEEIAVQRTMVKVDEGLEVMLKGAGGENLGGTIISLDDLDADATTVMTPRAWLTLQKKFKRSYMMTSGIGTDEDITDIQLAKISGTNVMLTAMIERDNAVLSGFGGAFRVMNQLSQGIGIGWHETLKDRLQWYTTQTGQTKATGSAAQNAYIAYDLRKAIEFVSQMNTDIIETTRDMLKQVEYIVCSEIWGWISYQPKLAIQIVAMGPKPNGLDENHSLRVVDPE